MLKRINSIIIPKISIKNFFPKLTNQKNIFKIFNSHKYFVDTSNTTSQKQGEQEREDIKNNKDNVNTNTTNENNIDNNKSNTESNKTSNKNQQEHKTEKESNSNSNLQEKYRELTNIYEEQNRKMDNYRKKFEEVKKAYLENKEEMDQIKIRYEREISNTKEYSISKFAKDLLDVHDNFNRAMQSIQDVDFKSLSKEEQIQLFETFIEGINIYIILKE
jgi:molecular chaperone GrpE (heat shock protein)